MENTRSTQARDYCIYFGCQSLCATAGDRRRDNTRCLSETTVGFLLDSRLISRVTSCLAGREERRVNTVTRWSPIFESDSLQFRGTNAWQPYLLLCLCLHPVVYLYRSTASDMTPRFKSSRRGTCMPSHAQLSLNFAHATRYERRHGILVTCPTFIVMTIRMARNLGFF